MTTALESFRNPPLEIEEIQPLIFNVAAQPVRADVTANNGYFNNLSVIGNATGTQNNSLTANFITPQQNFDYNNGDWHLGVYGVADGTAPKAVVFDIYERLTNPGVGPTKGGTFEKLSICSSPPSGPFIITTAFNSPGGSARDLSVIPSGALGLGANSAVMWTIPADGSGTLLPTGGAINIGSDFNPVFQIFANEFHVVNFASADVATFRFNGTVPVLTIDTAGYLVFPHTGGGTNPATVGDIRLVPGTNIANGIGFIGWRNGGQTTDILLGFDGNNRLVLNNCATGGVPGAATGSLTVFINGVQRQIAYT